MTHRAPHWRNRAACGARAALIMAAVATASPVRAEADGPDFFAVHGVALGDALNLRAGPSAAAAKLGALPAGTPCVRNLGCRGGLSLQEFSTLTPAQQQRRLRENPRWCRVEYRGQQGWAAGRYLAEDASGSCPR